MADKRSDNDKQRLAAIDKLLKDLPQAGSAMQDLQRALGVMNPSVMVDLASLQVERGIIEAQLKDDLIQEKTQEESAQAITAEIVAREHAKLTAKEHVEFERLMHKEVLDVKDANSVIAFVEKHPDTVEARKEIGHLITRGTPEARDQYFKFAQEHPESANGKKYMQFEDIFFISACDSSKDDHEKRKKLADRFGMERLQRYDNETAEQRATDHTIALKVYEGDFEGAQKINDARNKLDVARSSESSPDIPKVLTPSKEIDQKDKFANYDNSFGYEEVKKDSSKALVDKNVSEKAAIAAAALKGGELKEPDTYLSSNLRSSLNNDKSKSPG